MPSVRELVRDVWRAYEENDLLTFASAIAFQVFFALFPFTLFALGLLGTFGLSDLWRDEVAPDLRASVSPAAFTLIDNTALKVLGSQNVFWITAGLVIAVWAVSSAMRGVMDAFDRIYDSTRDRGAKERYLVSLAIAVAVGVLVLAAAALFLLGPLASGVLTFVRWPAAVVLLLASIVVQVHFAPADRQPLRWVSLGSVLCVVAWLGTSAAFVVYVRDLADYGSVYGALAVVIIAFEYFYLATAAFLTGAQVDQLLRERARADTRELA